MKIRGQPFPLLPGEDACYLECEAAGNGSRTYYEREVLTGVLSLTEQALSHTLVVLPKVVALEGPIQDLSHKLIREQHS